MTNDTKNTFSRRRFLKGASGLAAYSAVAGMFAGTPLHRMLSPIGLADAATLNAKPPHLYLTGTDGWISLPPAPTVSSPAFGLVHPDNKAPAPFNTYVFGFRNITGLTTPQIAAQKMKTQHIAPIFWVDEYDATANGGQGNEFLLDLTNLGLGMRPDLVDSHSMHWHGFRNVVPYFDGEPLGSVSVSIGRVFRYVFRPKDPGTYMFHCHVEDTEHVHMGMTGMVYVRPKQNGNTALYASGKYAYNDGDGSTGYDREFVMLLSEVWAEAHWCDSHIQLPEWTDYRPDFSLINGRCYPDTLAPNGSIDPFNPVRDASGDLIAPAGNPHLQYQPYSSLVTCNAGEKVLLRFANLGFRESSMTLTGIPMKVVGKDATPMRGLTGSARTGVDTSYTTSTVAMGAGESYDVIFQAPPHSGGPGPDVYVLYNRDYDRSGNLAGDNAGYAGQRTEVRVYPAGQLPAQTQFNDRAGA